MSSVRDILVGSVSRRYTETSLPGVGSVRIQSLTEFERAKVEAVAADDLTRMRATLLAFALVDDAGNRLFADGEVETILQMDSRITGELSTAVMLHVGRQDDTAAAVKN